MNFDSIKDFAEKKLPSSNNLDRQALLEHLGLQEQQGIAQTVLPAMGYFAAGLAAGFFAGMLVAPQSGEQTRKDVGQQAKRARKAATNTAESAVSDS